MYDIPRHLWTRADYVRYWAGIVGVSIFIGLCVVGILMGIATGYYGAGLKVYGGQFAAALVASLFIAAIVLRVLAVRK